MMTAMSAVTPPPPGVSGQIVVVAVAGALAAAPAILMIGNDTLGIDPTLVMLGWPALAFVGAVVLDRAPESRIGRAAAVVALTPLLLVAWTIGRHGTPVGPDHLRAVIDELGPVGMAPLLLLVLAALPAEGRLAGRRRFWVCTACIGVVVAVGMCWWLASPTVVGLAALAGLAAVSGTVATVQLAGELRPVDEPLLDLGIVVGALVGTASVGILVRWATELAGLGSADLSGAFAAATVAGLAMPAALWVRRSALARRYGRGVLTPDDVVAITADLGSETDPRELLGKAATMVAAASGNRNVRIVLGDDDPDEEGWTTHPLVVGAERVGTLMIGTAHAEGPEPRQQRVVAQLLPTVALVARAVALAVEAEHARRDVARERDAERSRILADLHDDLGPVLAGMSMRVQAARRMSGESWVDDLAADLAACRADLRRIVSGLTPSVLDSGDLAGALRRLIESFAGAAGGPTVVLERVPSGEQNPDVAVAVYRAVAEGLTNAVRHADASSVWVAVDEIDGRLRAVVSDDGTGGPVAPGIGLTSLRRRAQELGGSLDIGPGSRGGIELRLAVPLGGAA
jgi:signal transduction histidine kinase